MTDAALQLPPSVPARGNVVSRGIGRVILRLIGWKIKGELPNYPKMVVIVAPHTSNWDFPLGLAALFALGVRLVFLAKNTLFRPPFGRLMRWVGGIPVKRVVREDTVAIEVEVFRRNERWILALAPEGTRKFTDRWKTGFYHVAMGAGAPIIPVAFDYSAKTILIMAPFVPTGDLEGDVTHLRKLFRADWAHLPGKFDEIS